MVSRRETLRGVVYYLAGLAVTLVSPTLSSPLHRGGIFTAFAVVVLAIEAARRVQRNRLSERTTREPQVEVLLDALLRKYRERGVDCHLRANVMVPFENRPVRSFLSDRLGRRTLEFKDDTGGYSEDELEQSYEEGQGSCGIAWKRCRPVVYGEGQKEVAERAMTEDQVDATESVESILSVPIYDGERIPTNLVCVVNVDSENVQSETPFSSESIIEDTENHVDVIAAAVKEDYHA